MKKNKKVFLSAILFLLIGITIGLVIASKFDIQNKGFSEDYQISKDSQEILSKIGNAMAEVIQAVRPSVVNIYTTKKLKDPEFLFLSMTLFSEDFLMMNSANYLTDKESILKHRLAQE